MNNYDFLLPVLICVVLPVLIVWIVGRVRQNATNRRAEVMLKAIENGVEIDPNLLKPARDPRKTSIKRDLLDKLNGACITSLMGVAFLLLWLFADIRWFAAYLPFAGAMLLAVGIGLFISFFARKKMLAKEIEAEEKELLENK